MPQGFFAYEFIEASPRTTMNKHDTLIMVQFSNRIVDDVSFFENKQDKVQIKMVISITFGEWLTRNVV